MCLSRGRATCSSISSAVAPGITAITTPWRMVKAGISSLGITYMPHMPKMNSNVVMKAVIL